MSESTEQPTTDDLIRDAYQSRRGWVMELPAPKTTPTAKAADLWFRGSTAEESESQESSDDEPV